MTKLKVENGLPFEFFFTPAKTINGVLFEAKTYCVGGHIELERGKPKADVDIIDYGNYNFKKDFEMTGAIKMFKTAAQQYVERLFSQLQRA